MTPNQRVGFFYSDDMNIRSRYFRYSEDVAAKFKNGYMDYELSQMSLGFPTSTINPNKTLDGWILDADGDRLYQNFLNTGISDGHAYNGAGCAQASA